MSLEKVKEYFKAYGIEDRIIELSESSATVELAAHALHTEPCRIAKRNVKPTLRFSSYSVKIKVS